MPNWCQNTVTFKHRNPDRIARLVNSFNDNELLSEFIPIPQGTEDAYTWCVENWGTKWDINNDDYDLIVDPDSTEVTLCFSTAWSPPLKAYETLQEKYGFDILAYYYEAGMAFCGRWANGVDEFYDIDEDNAEWVTANIPSDIDEEFAISESYELWVDE